MKFISFLISLLAIFGIGAEEPTKVEQTLSIIKPDAVSSHHIGEIISRFEKAGLVVKDLKMIQLNRQEAENFYKVHEKKPFYKDLVDFMVSGPIVAILIEGQDAVAKNRTLMGATDPKKALPGTLRADFASSIQKNAVHGSDSPENAMREIAFFFKT